MHVCDGPRWSTLREPLTAVPVCGLLLLQFWNPNTPLSHLDLTLLPSDPLGYNTYCAASLSGACATDGYDGWVLPFSLIGQAVQAEQVVDMTGAGGASLLSLCMSVRLCVCVCVCVRARVRACEERAVANYHQQQQQLPGITLMMFGRGYPLRLYPAH